MRISRFLAGVAVFSFMFGASYALASFDSYKKELAASEKVAITYDVFDAAKAKKQIAQMKKEAKASRKVASNLTENDLSESAKAMIQEILSKTEPEALDQVLVAYDNKYDSLPADAQFITLQLQTLRPFRGILYRVKPYFEDKAGTLAHSAILTSFKNLAANLRWLLDAPERSRHAVAFFNYIAQPYLIDKALAPSLDSEAKIQTWMFNKVRPVMITANNRMQSLSEKNPRIVWDNRIIYGADSFQDNIDRFKLVGEIERQALIASYENTVSQINFLRSYSIYGAATVSQKLGEVMGIDSVIGTMFSSTRNGYTLRELRDAIKSAPHFGKHLADCKIINQQRQSVTCMRESYELLQSSVKRLATAWEIAKERPGSNDFAFNTAFAQADVARGDINVQNVVAVVEGPTTLRSAIAGEYVKFDIQKFYDTPPTNLQDFLPQSFDNLKERQVNLGKKRPVKYRNYFYGMPETWKIDAYREAFLPDAQNNDDILKASRIWAHSAGGMVRLNL